MIGGRRWRGTKKGKIDKKARDLPLNFTAVPTWQLQIDVNQI